MKTQPTLFFSPFRLDLGNEQLWHGSQALSLRPKTFAVLAYLVKHSGQLVTKEELLDTIWPNIYVSDVLPKDSVMEIRKVLGDNARAPRFIETVHGRGYRFIATLTTMSLQSLVSRVPRRGPEKQDFASALDARHKSRDVPQVGREAELAQLHHWLDKALNGEQQTVFVTGEAGIGKTSLAEAFLDRVAATRQVWIGQGQCVAHCGAGEPYLPVLEALGRLGRAPDGRCLRAVLHQYAPTWLVHLPALLRPAERAQLQREGHGATPHRMLREMAEALEVFTAERALILKLEDLHWSDTSSLTLLSFLAQRREPARLLIIGTYRPAEVLGTDHPLRAVAQELQGHQQGMELRLATLSEAAVSTYVTRRLAAKASDRGFLHHLSRAIYRRTEGNPLFVVNMVDALMARH